MHQDREGTIWAPIGGGLARLTRRVITAYVCQGLNGETGPTGEGLMSGSMLLLPAGSPAPTGYTLVGTFELTPASGPRGRPMMVLVDV